MYIYIYRVPTIGLIKGETRSLDQSPADFEGALKHLSPASTPYDRGSNSHKATEGYQGYSHKWPYK